MAYSQFIAAHDRHPVASLSNFDSRTAVCPVSATFKPTIMLRGVSPDSPFGENAAAMLAGFSEIAFESGKAPERSDWRRAVRGTTLGWWSKAKSASMRNNLVEIDIALNLHRQEMGRAGRTWCIVDAAGVPLFHPLQALEVCYSEPYVAALNLIESEDSGDTWQLVAEAHVSSARNYRELLDVLGRTSVRLLHRALRTPNAPRRPWVPHPPASGRSQTLLRARMMSGLAWLHARVSGEVYGIAILNRSPEQFLQSGTCWIPHWIQAPASKGFIADPFFWPGQPGVLLCETYSHRTGLGQLTVLSIDGGRVTESEPMPLGLTCHLSYPSTWLEDGRVLCLPEMAGSRRQILYELRRGVAPEPLCIISENAAMADATLMKVNGLYWIAYTDTDIGTYDNLCLRYAYQLEGPWLLHPGNPVKIDARSSRPGGTPFWVGDQLFRPAQDCSREYGGAVVINLVKICTPEDYQEIPTSVLRPDPGGPFPDGLHTLSFGNDCAVIDGKRISFHPLILFHKIRRALNSAWGKARLNMP